jgi:hypothetical protein
VQVVQQREGVFDDFEPVDAGTTDAVAAEDEFGSTADNLFDSA